MTLETLIKKINTAGVVLIEQNGTEKQIIQGTMINEFLTLSVKGDAKKILIDTTDIKNIAQKNGLISIGGYMLTTKRISVAVLSEMINHAKYFLLDADNMHYSFDQQQITGDEANAAVVLKRDPIFRDLRADGYDSYNFTVSGNDKITMLDASTVRINDLMLTCLNY